MKVKAAPSLMSKMSSSWTAALFRLGVHFSRNGMKIPHFVLSLYFVCLKPHDQTRKYEQFLPLVLGSIPFLGKAVFATAKNVIMTMILSDYVESFFDCRK